MGKKAFIFPGQGAQRAGMGRDFYEASATAREVYDSAGDWLGLDMKDLCFEKNDRLDLTEYTQAALLTTCLAMEKVVEERGLAPDVAAGLSLGEYCAIETAGGMSLREAVTTVRRRGILMEQAVPAGTGGMSAVLGLEAEIVEQVLREIPGAEIANYNCPGQIVITGRRDAVELAGAQLKQAGAKRILPLNVSGPFHSSMLSTAGEKLLENLNQVTFGELKIPYVTNVTAEAVTDSRQIRGLLARQISSSVRWQQSVEHMIASGVDTFVEIGPGRTLTGFIRKIDKGVRAVNIQTIADVDVAIEMIKNAD